MSFLDDIKSRLPFGQNQGSYGQDGYGQDDGYADDYYDGNGYGDGYQQDGYGSSDSYAGGGYGSSEPSNGILGQTRRGEAESVAVYTRSGQLVGDADRHATTYNPPSRQESGYRPGAYDTPSSYAATVRSHASTPAPTPRGRRFPKLQSL